MYNQVFAGSLPTDSGDVLHHRTIIGQMQVSVSFGLSMFHTVFNVATVILILPLTNLWSSS